MGCGGSKTASSSAPPEGSSGKRQASPDYEPPGETVGEDAAGVNAAKEASETPVDSITVHLSITGVDPAKLNRQHAKNLKASLVIEISGIAGVPLHSVKDLYGIGASVNMAHGQELKNGYTSEIFKANKSSHVAVWSSLDADRNDRERRIFVDCCVMLEPSSLLSTLTAAFCGEKGRGRLATAIEDAVLATIRCSDVEVRAAVQLGKLSTIKDKSRYEPSELSRSTEAPPENQSGLEDIKIAFSDTTISAAVQRANLEVSLEPVPPPSQGYGLFWCCSRSEVQTIDMESRMLTQAALAKHDSEAVAGSDVLSHAVSLTQGRA